MFREKRRKKISVCVGSRSRPLQTTTPFPPSLPQGREFSFFSYQSKWKWFNLKTFFSYRIILFFTIQLIVTWSPVLYRCTYYTCVRQTNTWAKKQSNFLKLTILCYWHGLKVYIHTHYLSMTLRNQIQSTKTTDMSAILYWQAPSQKQTTHLDKTAMCITALRPLLDHDRKDSNHETAARRRTKVSPLSMILLWTEKVVGLDPEDPDTVPEHTTYNQQRI